MATKVGSRTIVQTFVEHGVIEALIPGVVIEVDDEDEALDIQHASDGITRVQRDIYLSEWYEVEAE